MNYLESILNYQEKEIIEKNAIKQIIKNNFETRSIVKRPGREIKVNPSIIQNDKITAKIGTVENRNEPNTVFITLGFWIDIKKKILENNQLSLLT